MSCFIQSLNTSLTVHVFVFFSITQKLLAQTFPPDILALFIQGGTNSSYTVACIIAAGVTILGIVVGGTLKLNKIKGFYERNKFSKLTFKGQQIYYIYIQFNKF